MSEVLGLEQEASPDSLAALAAERQTFLEGLAPNPSGKEIEEIQGATAEYTAFLAQAVKQKEE